MAARWVSGFSVRFESPCMGVRSSLTLAPVRGHADSAGKDDVGPVQAGPGRENGGERRPPAARRVASGLAVRAVGRGQGAPLPLSLPARHGTYAARLGSEQGPPCAVSWLQDWGAPADFECPPADLACLPTDQQLAGKLDDLYADSEQVTALATALLWSAQPSAQPQPPAHLSSSDQAACAAAAKPQSPAAVAQRSGAGAENWEPRLRLRRLPPDEGSPEADRERQVQVGLSVRLRAARGGSNLSAGPAPSEEGDDIGVDTAASSDDQGLQVRVARPERCPRTGFP